MKILLGKETTPKNLMGTPDQGENISLLSGPLKRQPLNQLIIDTCMSEARAQDSSSQTLLVPLLSLEPAHPPVGPSGPGPAPLFPALDSFPALDPV